ncbi:MAG TPA: hypothetical protein VIL55_15970 [Naasia sp.]|jgi:hypothetical protein
MYDVPLGSAASVESCLAVRTAPIDTWDPELADDPSWYVTD